MGVAGAACTGTAGGRLVTTAGDDRSRELVERAHEGLKDAIAELRDLVRGIHPAVLTDRGLDAAVSALVARSPIPVDMRSGLQRRLPGAVESVAYFVVAEASTNAMKHSDAGEGDDSRRWDDADDRGDRRRPDFEADRGH